MMLTFNFNHKAGQFTGPSWKKIFRYLTVVFCLSAPLTLRAHELDRYQYKVSTTVLAALSYGPNATMIQNRHMSLLIQADRELTADNVKTSTANAMILGKYKSYKVNADLELDAGVENGTLETKISVGQLDALLYDWEETYDASRLLKAFQQQTKQLTFHEGEGFDYNCSLKRDFEYLLSIHIAYDPATNKMQDRSSDLAALAKFIRAMEGDSRSRQILSNNKSGLPVFISITEDKGEPIFHARHPMHEIVWGRSTGFQGYAYLDSLDDVKMIPEIKRILNDASVKKFVGEAGGPIRVNVKGNQKDGFVCIFVNPQAGKQLVAKLVNKKVVVETAN